MKPLEIFEVGDHGRVDGKPYVLPHAPGERAYGLLPGYYYWDPDGDLQGPFACERHADQDRARTWPVHEGLER